MKTEPDIMKIGYPDFLIPDGSDAVITLRCDRDAFRPLRFTMEPKYAHRFQILNISIGTSSIFTHQMWSEGGIPGTDLLEAKGGLQRFDPCVLKFGQDLTFVVRNISERPHAFEAIVRGVTADVST